NGEQTSTYTVWITMKDRCFNPNSRLWKHYGGRGITVCDRWLDYTNFVADMGERPPGLWIERRDNTQGYSPENCSWETRKTQSLNKGNTVFVSLYGELVPLRVACERYGLKYNTVHNYRQREKAPLDEVLFERLQREVGRH